MEEVEFIEMVHPGIDGSAQATRDAFEQVWKSRGWLLKPPVVSRPVGVTANTPPQPPATPAPSAPNPSEEV